MKKRLDILVAEKADVSRTKAQAIIMAGQVFVDGKKSEKPGTMIDENINIIIEELFPYVSRGALKLERAHQEFNINFKNKIVCDIGSSTGGFTDYALQNGAKKVYAIDVGRGQLAQKIREDKRVVAMERTNIKDVDSLPEIINIFVTDVSFISVKVVLEQIKEIISIYSVILSDSEKSRSLDSTRDDNRIQIIALVKPQFEVGKKIADNFRGVITDEKIQKEVLADIIDYAKSLGYIIEGKTTSPIKGAKGNVEFLLYLTVNTNTQNTNSK